MALAGFAPTATTLLSAGPTSSNIILPTTGSPVTAVVTNTSQGFVYVLLGGSNVTVTPATGLALAPGASFPLTIGTNTYLAAITLQGAAGVNITVGT
jgi:hypothetical protein